MIEHEQQVIEQDCILFVWTKQKPSEPLLSSSSASRLVASYSLKVHMHEILPPGFFA